MGCGGHVGLMLGALVAQAATFGWLWVPPSQDWPRSKQWVPCDLGHSLGCAMALWGGAPWVGHVGLAFGVCVRCFEGSRAQGKCPPQTTIPICSLGCSPQRPHHPCCVAPRVCAMGMCPPSTTANLWFVCNWHLVSRVVVSFLQGFEATHDLGCWFGVRALPWATATWLAQGAPVGRVAIAPPGRVHNCHVGLFQGHLSALKVLEGALVPGFVVCCRPQVHQPTHKHFPTAKGCPRAPFRQKIKSNLRVFVTFHMSQEHIAALKTRLQNSPEAQG